MSSRYLYPRDRNTNFTLCIFEEDEIRIKDFVRKLPYIETGGNLFGLWTNHGNAVVLVATGPGKNCKRTTVSFYQDIPYMKHVGGYLTTEYPLCHIGEWHSHHQLQLYEPSDGDCYTVRNNYPTGSQGFVLMIANVQRNGKVKLSPYKFVDERSPYQRGKVEVLNVENPFMKDEQILYKIKEGEERTPEGEVLVEHREYDINIRSRMRDRSHHGHSSGRDRLRSSSRSRSRSRSPLKKTDSLSPAEAENDPQRKEQEDAYKYRHLPQPPSQEKSPIQQRMKRGGFNLVPLTTSEKSKLLTTNLGVKQKTTPIRRFSRSQVETGFTGNNAQNHTDQWYETNQDDLRVLEFVTCLSDDKQTVDISRNASTKNLTMKFTHHSNDWAVDFPRNFPQGTIKLKEKLYGLHGSYANTYTVNGIGDVDGFGALLKSTLQDKCMKCKEESILYGHTADRQEPTSVTSYQARSLHLPVRSQNTRQQTTPSTQNHTDQWYEKYPDDLKRVLGFVTSLSHDEQTVDISRDTSTKNLTMKFVHHDCEWEVDFPKSFPRESAKLKRKLFYSESYNESYVLTARNVNSFKHEVESILIANCTQCATESRELSRTKIVSSFAHRYKRI